MPGGELGYLPFELLIEGGKPLVAGHRIRYAPSLTTLHFTRRWNSARIPPDRKLFAVGDPTPLGPGAKFEPLPGSRAEVERIRDLMRATPDDILLADRATEGAIMERSASGSLARYRYIHFATHGKVGIADGEQPALVLTGDGQGKDGLLELDEVAALKLNADLVVLSACETGLGKLDEAEGNPRAGPGLPLRRVPESSLHALEDRGSRNLELDDRSVSGHRGGPLPRPGAP